MKNIDRRKIRSRRRVAPAVDRLEERALLSATPMSPRAQMPVPQADVSTTIGGAEKFLQNLRDALTGALQRELFAARLALAGSSTQETLLADTDLVLSPLVTKSAQATYSPIVGAYNPTQLETAYGVNQLGTSNQGQGETIAIVDELDDPDIISDANTYSATYNLPQFNGTSGPKMWVQKDADIAPVGSAANTGIGDETSLDVEMVHAMAPQANILLVEVPATGSTANQIKELMEGVQYAAAQSGTSGISGTPVVAVSLSYGASESSVGASNVTSYNSTYFATGAASNVIVTVSTGDSSSPSYPATSPNVVAVGGTSLYLASARGKYSYETAWGGLAGAGAGGGGLSTNFGPPTFQSSNGVNFSKRAIPDVSMVADPVTAVSVYDSFDASYNNDGDPWTAYGGTSVAAPVTAGVLGLAQQDLIAASKPILNSVQADTAFYEAYNSPSYSTYFHDITLGNNSNVNSRGRTTVTGFNATTGYDEATGIGSLIANTLVPYLASQ
jgi:subtilase family serine protease